MKITKYEHSCLVVEDKGQKLVIDPGEWTTTFPDNEKYDGVVITHVHADHLGVDHLKAMLKTNPSLTIYTVPDAQTELTKAGIESKTAKAGELVTIGNFKIEFFGGEHAQIHSSIPIAQNVGVMVNDTLYHPGDSFATPYKPVKILSLPVSAPWMKIGEAMDFLIAVKPEIAFPTHNILLSDQGHSLADRLVSAAAGFVGEYRHLLPGESIEV